ncbi:uncharacterized protein LOC142345366 [Convolutriloba macropyga]|uniref:uncharacterized protein LOC142345366 n=1 Tax=Convolutriloba macropyga TaxID=536237 RepID=UPI003F51E553
MCLMSVLRKVGAVGGLISTFVFLFLSTCFHLPLLWYLDYLTIEWVGGMWHYCQKPKTVTTTDDWKCTYIDKNECDRLGQDWGEYGTLRTLVPLSELIAVALLVLFYASLCIKSKFLGLFCVVGSVAVFIFIMTSSAIAQTAFEKTFGQETEAEWCLYIVWLCWVSTAIAVAFAVTVIVSACLDD